MTEPIPPYTLNSADMTLTDNLFEIKICVVGEPSSGKDTLAKMLFLSNSKARVRIEPLSKLGQMYVEGICNNSTKTSKWAAHKKLARSFSTMCDAHNNAIMQQREIPSTDALRAQGITPFFKRAVIDMDNMLFLDPLEADVTYPSEDYAKLPSNMYATYHFIGNNYQDFMHEILSANILIYVTDRQRDSRTDSELCRVLGDIMARPSERPVHLFVLVNKCDDIVRPNQQVAARQQWLRVAPNSQCVTVMRMSFYWAYVLRMLEIGCRDELDQGLMSRLVTECPSNKPLMSELLCEEEYLENSGFLAFQRKFIQVLCETSRSIVAHNFTTEICGLELELNRSQMEVEQQPQGPSDDADQLDPIETIDLDEFADGPIPTEPSKPTEPVCVPVTYNPPTSFAESIELLRERAALVEGMTGQKTKALISDLVSKYLAFASDHTHLLLPSCGSASSVLLSIHELSAVFKSSAKMTACISASLDSIQQGLADEIGVILDKIEGLGVFDSTTNVWAFEEVAGDVILILNCIDDLHTASPDLKMDDTASRTWSLFNQAIRMYYGNAGFVSNPSALSYFYSFSTKPSPYDLVYRRAMTHIQSDQLVYIDGVMQYLLTKLWASDSYLWAIGGNHSQDSQQMVRYFYELACYITEAITVTTCTKARDVLVYLRIACEEVANKHRLLIGSGAESMLDYIYGNRGAVIGTPRALILNDPSIPDALTALIEAYGGRAKGPTVTAVPERKPRRKAKESKPSRSTRKQPSRKASAKTEVFEESDTEDDNAYNQFLSTESKRLRTANPSISGSECMKRAAETWRKQTKTK
ncbi:Hypothetical protein MVR_LOCUS296 [uncultured virus]|nr:Hypothetical protein MVR_LOCUS296 [uncultured virus]